MYFYCELNGQVFDDLKEKRDSIRKKAQRLEEIRMQISSLDLKANELTKVSNDERILL